MSKITIDDFARVRRLSDLTVSPGGTCAALTVNTVNLEKNRYENDIWICENGSIRRLTGGGDGTKALWLDDETILFPSDRAEEAKEGEKITVYNRISIRGGEAERAFRVPLKVTSLTRIQGGKFLAAATFDNAPADRAEDRGYSVFDELPFWFNGKGIVNKLRTRLYLIDPASEEPQPLTEPLFAVNGSAYDEENNLLAYWGCAYESLNPQKDGMYLMNLPDGNAKKIDVGENMRISSACFALGGLVFFGSTGETMGTSENEKVYFIDTETGDVREILRPDVTFGNGVGSDVHSGGASLCACPDGILHIETLGNSSHLCMLDFSGIRVITPSTHCVEAVAAKGGTVYFTGTPFNGLQELYVMKDGTEPVRVSHFNDAFLAEKTVSDPKALSFLDRDGIRIDGWVIPPVDYDPEKRYPAILDVHGGPRTVYGDVFFHEMQYWAAQGYFVFFCNPRGSSGRGDAFADILGDQYGVRDYHDLMDFTDEVLKRYPAIDEKRVAMTGGSYGGFMANWIIGHTDRFAAVASQRSISNYVSKCLTTDIGYYHNLSAIQADPWSSAAKMWEHSPLKYADRAVTPTLFIQSDEDYRCWMGDAVQMLQALLMRGVPAKMCLFHGENHELSRNGKPKNRIGRLSEITGWFDRYCGKAE